MNRSFNSPGLGKSPFSPRSRQSIGSKKLLPTSFRKSSRFSVSGKSAQSAQIILSTTNNCVESFGANLPVLITEALISSRERNSAVSARISKNGYAWVVCGRRLLIWQYSVGCDVPHKQSALLNQYFELQLSQSDLAHRAELVSIFINQGSSAPSCIAVSPEGVIRYWPAIVHDSVSTEEHVNLQGQECDSLTDAEGLGCILATTTCTILLIQPYVTNGRHSLKTKPLRIPSGWLGGISKRMSSLIFGPMPSDHIAETRMVRVLSPSVSEPWTVYVLADHNLQKWNLSKPDVEQLIFVAELNRMIREKFRAAAAWENSAADQSEIDTWLLDLQADKENVIILAAAVNISVSPRVHYAMICLQTNTQQPPSAIKDFYLLKITDLYTEDNSSDALSYRLLLCGTSAFLYNSKCIVVIKPQEEPDTLPFNTAHDYLLAGIVYVNSPIFFSKKHGVVLVSHQDMDLNMSMASPNVTAEITFNNTNIVNNLSLFNVDLESNAYTVDALGRLKTAFIHHVRNQEQAYREIVNEVFPMDCSKLPAIDAILDKVSLLLCQELTDDVPAEDPRWKGIPQGLGSSYSMQIQHQLEDKVKALSLFIKFLKDSGLWGQLSASTIRDTTMATVYIIGEYAEKICAALTQKKLPHDGVLKKALENAVAEVHMDNGLTHQDHFYRYVSSVQRGIQEMAKYCEDVAYSDSNPVEIVEVIHESNSLILEVMREVLKYRQQNSEFYKPTDAVLRVAPSFLPWTAANGNEGLANSLSQMHFLTYNYGVILTNNDHLKNELWEQLVGLTDILLDGRKSHLESIKNTSSEEILFKQYSADRQKYMKPFLSEKEYERAAKLAEKYMDFETLVLICEATNNQRLDEYIDRFGNSGFSEFVYNWFLKENKQGILLDKCRQGWKSRNVQKLTSFLAEHPKLAWIQYTFDKKYNLAADTLQKLATEETESVTRQRTMFSLCKLAKLAAPAAPDTDNYLKNIGARLELITFQEEIPDYVLQQFGYDTVHIKVIPPHDMINLYICPEYKEAGELEFKKALDLLEFVKDEELNQELSLKIWTTALLRDSWKHSNLDSPIEILQNKLFFKIIDLILVIDEDGLKLLPPLDHLLNNEALDKLKNTNFEFLIKTGYEHVYRTHTIG